MVFQADSGDVLHPYGEFYQDDTGQVITITTVNVDVAITGNTEGSLFNVLHTDGELTIQDPGTYKIDYSVSFSGSAGREIEFSVCKDGSRQPNTTCHRTLGGNDTGNVGGTGIIDLQIGEVITLEVRNETDNANIVIEHLNFVIRRIKR